MYFYVHINFPSGVYISVYRTRAPTLQLNMHKALSWVSTFLCIVVLCITVNCSVHIIPSFLCTFCCTKVSLKFSPQICAQFLLSGFSFLCTKVVALHVFTFLYTRVPASGVFLRVRHSFTHSFVYLSLYILSSLRRALRQFLAQILISSLQRAFVSEFRVKSPTYHG